MGSEYRRKPVVTVAIPIYSTTVTVANILISIVILDFFYEFCFVCCCFVVEGKVNAKDIHFIVWHGYSHVR